MLLAASPPASLTLRAVCVVLEPALHYLHLLARDPTLTNIQLERRCRTSSLRVQCQCVSYSSHLCDSSMSAVCRYQREVLSWREMPQPRSERSQGRGGQRKRQRQAAAASSASYASAAPALPPLSLPTPPRPPPPFLLPSSTSTFPFQSSGLHIHPSLQTPASPPPPFFPHMLDPLLIPPPLPRRRKPVDRCTSPSHFLMTPLTLTPYGPDESIDLPVRSRMDDLLLSVLAGFFTPRLVMSEDVGKVWMDADAVVGVGFTPRAYGSLERLLSPLRKRRPRERWSLKEVAAFELGICLHGKDFHKVHQLVSRPQSEVQAAWAAVCPFACLCAVADAGCLCARDCAVCGAGGQQVDVGGGRVLLQHVEALGPLRPVEEQRTTSTHATQLRPLRTHPAHHHRHQRR